MKKNFRIVKSGIILGILLFSLFAIFVPTSSAGILKVPPLIVIQYPTQDKNVIPNSGRLAIELSTTFDLTGPWASFAKQSPLLKESVIQVTLKVESSPDWCDASISNPTVGIKLGDTISAKSQLTLTVTEQAPAFQQGTIVISATSVEQKSLLMDITSKRYDYDVSFLVGYWPVVGYESTKGTLLEIGPLNTADFPIVFKNLGNGKTKVKLEIIEIPSDGWSAGIDSSINLDSAVGSLEGTEGTVHLVIKPPYGFGFHNDIQTFKIRFTPYYLGAPEERPDLVGVSEEITFTVQSVGFSPGTGFEIPLIVIVLIGIALLIYLYKRRKK